jgi:hypothetical protein
MADKKDEEPDWFKKYQKDADRLSKHLHDTIPTAAPCPMCREDKWRTGMRVELTLSDRADHVWPAILLSCGNCGLTLLFGAVQTGVLRARGESVDDEDSDQDADGESK